MSAPIDAPSPGEVYDTPRPLHAAYVHDALPTRACHRRVFLGILDGTPCCQVCPVDVAMSCEVVGGGTTAAGTFPHLYIPCQRDRRRSAVGAISYVASRCARTKGHHTAAWQSDYHDALDDVIGSWRRTAERIHTNSFKWDVSHRVSAETAPGKIRNLDVPTMRDRLVGRCLYVAMRDNMECMLPRTVVGCRSGGGPQSGGNALARCVQNGLTWAARTDVQDMYGSIGHELAMSAARRLTHCARMLTLIQRYITTPWRMGHGGKIHERHIGIPCGGGLSPMLAQVVMAPIDMAMQEAGYIMLRYIRWLTENEEARLQAAFPPQWWPTVLLALLTGLRASELFGLQWEYVDFANGILTIPRSKRGEKRHVPMSPRVREILRAMPSRLKSPWVFPLNERRRGTTPHEAPEHLTFRSIHVIFEKALEAAGISGFHWHDLRHTFASRLVMKGVDLRTVQELMGHKTIIMTKRYAHLSPSHLQRAVDLLCESTEAQPIVSGTATKTATWQKQPSGKTE